MNIVRRTLLSIAKKAETLLNRPELLLAKLNGISTGFAKDILLVRDHLGQDAAMVLDVGAAYGEYARTSLYLFQKAKVIAFEPIPDSFRKLATLAEQNQRLAARNVALGRENGKVDFHLNEFSFSSSMLKMTDVHKTEFPFTTKESIIAVDCVRLDSIPNLVIDRPCVLKMDVQGSELDVLEGAGKLLEKIDAVQLEVNFEYFYEGQARYDELFSFMLSHGYKRFLQTDPLISRDGRLLASDVIFLK